jgi:hypothetical protein
MKNDSGTLSPNLFDFINLLFEKARHESTTLLESNIIYSVQLVILSMLTEDDRLKKIEFDYSCNEWFVPSPNYDVHEFDSYEDE